MDSGGFDAEFIPDDDPVQCGDRTAGVEAGAGRGDAVAAVEILEAAPGVAAMRPLTLREVAEAIEMHESTVSRVTQNKYLLCDRGMFELKYFFGSGVGSGDGEGAAAEAVKAAIGKLIAAESEILSDDDLVELLKIQGFDVARRTVAKYREAIGIGSSIQRRRQRKMAGA